MKNKEKDAEKNMTNELKKSPGWTPERRRRQAERIRRQRPWLHSTGPRTAAGKAVSSHNALIHGLRSRARRVLCLLLRVQRDFVRNLNAFPCNPRFQLVRNPVEQGNVRQSLRDIVSISKLG